MMYQKSKVFVLILICISGYGPILAQETRLPDIQWKDLSPLGGLSGRYSLVEGKPNRISGLYGGAAYGEKHKVWLGIYWMNAPVTEFFDDPTRPQLGYITRMEGKMWYVSLAYEYAFLMKGNWKLSAPVQLGLGRVKENYISLADKKIYKVEKTPVIPLEFGVNAQYLFFEWLGVKAGLGTRIAIGNDLAGTYSGPFSAVGVLFYFGPLYRKLPENWQIIPKSR
jgi:hypothetical protein